MTDYPLIKLSTDNLFADPARYSFSFPSPEAEEALEASMTRFGALTPLIAVEKAGVLALADGRRRLALLSNLGVGEVFVRVAPQEKLWDLLLETRKACGSAPNPVEIGLYLKKRMADTGETLADLATEVFPSLGLSPRPSAAEDLLWLAGLPEADALRFSSGETAAAGLRLLSAAPREEALAVLEALRGRKLGSNKFYETARWLMECAWKENATVAEWLSGANLPPPDSPPGDFREAVWRSRYPTLAAWSDSFDSDVASLGLPKDAQLSHPSGFEGGKLRLTLAFDSLETLGANLRATGEALDSGRMDSLKRYLG